MKRIFILTILMICFASIGIAGSRVVKHFDSRWKRSGHDAIFDSDHERGAN